MRRRTCYSFACKNLGRDTTVALSPDYVITRLIDGARVMHNVMHRAYTHGADQSDGR
jgi:hypothetical protein